MRKQASSLLFYAIAAIPTLIYVAALLWDPGRTLVLWERAPSLNPSSILPLALGLSLYAGLVFFIQQHVNERLTIRQAALLLSGIFLAGCALQVTAVAVTETYPLRGILLRQYSSFTSGYWSVGAPIEDVRTFLAQYASQMSSYPVHPQRHPPGLPLLFWLNTQVASLFPGLAASASSWLRPLACFDDQAGWLSDAQIASGFLGAVLETVATFIVIVPLYALVKRLAGVKAAALSAMLYVMVPGTLVWASQFDRTFPLVSITGLWLAEKMVNDKRHHLIVALALGLILALGVMASFGNLPIIVLCALYSAVRILQREQFTRWRVRAIQAFLVLAGIVMPWAAAVLFFQFDALGTYRMSMAFHLILERDFWPFVVWHAWDIFTFIGLPLASIALMLCWRRAPALALSFAGTLALLSGLHVARGETGRVWMYFAPLAVALAGIVLADRTRAQQAVVISLLIAQGVTHIGLLRVIDYGLDPLTVQDAPLPASLMPTEIRYDRNGELQLLGYTLSTPETPSLTLKPGDYSTITFYWKLDSSQPISTSYKVFVHAATALDDQQRVVNQDSKPMNWKLPTTCWRPGQVVRDEHAFRVDENAMPGDYVVLIGLYDELSNQRAYVHTAQRAMNSAVELDHKLVITR